MTEGTRTGAEAAETNRKIIEMECAKRAVTVTPQEIEAMLNEDLKGLGFSRDQFRSQCLGGLPDRQAPREQREIHRHDRLLHG